MVPDGYKKIDLKRFFLPHAEVGSEHRVILYLISSARKVRLGRKKAEREGESKQSENEGGNGRERRKMFEESPV